MADTHGRVTTEFHADGNMPRCDAHPDRYALMTTERPGHWHHSRPAVATVSALCVECVAAALADADASVIVTIHDC